MRDRGAVHDIAAIYSQAHALVIPSFVEGLPNVVVEAFSFGVPCIGFSDCEGVAHLVRHQETGLLVDRNDPQGLQNAMQEIADPQVQSSLSAAAFEFARRPDRIPAQAPDTPG